MRLICTEYSPLTENFFRVRGGGTCNQDMCCPGVKRKTDVRGGEGVSCRKTPWSLSYQSDKKKSVVINLPNQKIPHKSRSLHNFAD